MSKNPNKKTHSAKPDSPMSPAMKFFLLGCVSELYLLIVRRFFYNGTAEQQIAWYDVNLKVFLILGVVLLGVGAFLFFKKKDVPALRLTGSLVGVLGAFLVVSNALILLNMSLLTPLYVIVPVVMLLGILWTLYDRECALALTILGFALIVLWIFRRAGASMYVGVLIKVIAIVFIVAAIVVTVLAHAKKLGKLVPASADLLPVDIGCVISVLAVASAFFSAVVAYYATWALAVVVFAFGIYYTVKQL